MAASLNIHSTAQDPVNVVDGCGVYSHRPSAPPLEGQVFARAVPVNNNPVDSVPLPYDIFIYTDNTCQWVDSIKYFALRVLGSQMGYALVMWNPVSATAVVAFGAIALVGCYHARLAAEYRHQRDYHGNIQLIERYGSLEYKLIFRNEVKSFVLGFIGGAVFGVVQRVFCAIVDFVNYVSYINACNAEQFRLATAQSSDFLSTNQLPMYNKLEVVGNNYRISWFMEKSNVNLSPHQIPGASMFIDKIVSGYESVREIARYVTETLPNGASVTTPEYVTHYEPIYKEVFGYVVSLKNWVAPAAPARVIPWNLSGLASLLAIYPYEDHKPFRKLRGCLHRIYYS